VARAARQGALTVSDSHGRLLAEARTAGASFVSVTADVPADAIPTLYTRFGDWFAWACALLLVAIFAGAAARPRRAAERVKARRPDPGPVSVDRLPV
jgi:apolipoprotein N-acyltransferase